MKKLYLLTGLTAAKPVKFLKKSGGVKYVFKNNLPECVLLSPEYYNEMVERIIDMELYIEALEREAKTQKVYSEEEVLKKFGIDKVNPDDSEVEIE